MHRFLGLGGTSFFMSPSMNSTRNMPTGSSQLHQKHALSYAIKAHNASLSKAPYTLSVKLSDFTVWRHIWQKNWVNCAVLTGNSAGLRTVVSSRLSHRELRNSLRESGSFLSLPADTTMASSQGTSVSSNLIFVVPSIMLYSSEIRPTRRNNCVFILRNGFTLHVSGDNLTHYQEYICCIWPQVSRLT